MPEIIEQYYAPLLKGHGFIPDPDNQQYGSLGISWKLSPEIGEGSYWTYGQKDLYDIKIHNFTFHEDSLLEFSLPECLSITRYDSISGEELAPYRRLSAGCIKTYIGGYSPYRVLIHKNIPIRSIGVEIMPAYYEDYLKKQYPDEYHNPVEACLLYTSPPEAVLHKLALPGFQQILPQFFVYRTHFVHLFSIIILSNNDIILNQTIVFVKPQL